LRSYIFIYLQIIYPKKSHTPAPPLVIITTFKLGYNEQLGTGQICLL
jgi:hypothetical protein